MTSDLTVADVNEEKYNKINLCSIAVTRVLKSMFNMRIWLNVNFIILAMSEVLIYGSRLIPFLFIKGDLQKKINEKNFKPLSLYIICI